MNVYQRGAHDGLLMGAYLSATFLLQIAFPSMPMLMLFGDLMLLAVPFVAFFMMRRAYRQEQCRSHFSTLWMHGITIFICGSLILGIVAWAYLRLVNPTCIANLFSTASKLYLSFDDPQMQHIGVTLGKMIDKKMLPTPISMAFGMMWLGSFLGAMLSLILAGILKLTNKPK